MEVENSRQKCNHHLVGITPAPRGKTPNWMQTPLSVLILSEVKRAIKHGTA